MKKIAPRLVNNILNVVNVALQQYNAVMYVCVLYDYDICCPFTSQAGLSGTGSRN